MKKKNVSIGNEGSGKNRSSTIKKNEPFLKKRFSKGSQRFTKEVHNKGGEDKELTPIRAEVLRLLTVDLLTPEQIALRRGTTARATYKTISWLKKNGFLSLTFSEVQERGVTSIGNEGQKIRLHNQQFSIKILFKSMKYRGVANGSHVLIDGQSVVCYRDSIQVYANASFFGKSAEDATAESFKYWLSFFRRLEQEFKILIIKPRYQNIRLVRSHYAEVGNELARSCVDHGDKIQVRALDDGRIWFLIDNSFNLKEAETVHPETAFRDMGEVIEPFFNDLRKNNPPPVTELWRLLAETMKIQREQGVALLSMVKGFRPPVSNVVEGPLGRPEYIG